MSLQLVIALLQLPLSKFWQEPMFQWIDASDSSSPPLPQT